MYPNQMVPLMETFVQKRTYYHKLYAKKWEKITILKKIILRHIYNIQNSSSRWDASAIFFFTIFSPQIYDLMDRKKLNTTQFDLTGPT